MPIPESELFLASKPTVPPTFDGVDYNDTARLKAAQDAIIREQWVRSMMARLVREELGRCYRREGVNHLEKCGRLRGMQHQDWEKGFIRIVVDEFIPSLVPDYGRVALTDRIYLERYMELLPEAKVRGYLFQQQNYIPKDS